MQINCSPTVAPSCQPRLRQVWLNILSPCHLAPRSSLSSELRGAEFAWTGDTRTVRKTVKTRNQTLAAPSHTIIRTCKTHNVHVRESLGREVGKAVHSSVDETW
jgi:hypothetical protein